MADRRGLVSVVGDLGAARRRRGVAPRSRRGPCGAGHQRVVPHAAIVLARPRARHAGGAADRLVPGRRVRRYVRREAPRDRAPGRDARGWPRTDPGPRTSIVAVTGPELG